MVSYSGSIPPLPYTALLDLLRYTRKVDGVSKDMDLENPGASAHAAEWDTTSLEDFRKSVLWTEVGRQTVDCLAATFFSMNISELKLTNYFYAVASDGGWDNHSDKDQSRKFNIKLKGGWKALCNKLVHEIDECNIAKNKCVTCVEDNSHHAIIKTAEGKQYTTKTVVCTVPPNVLGAIEFDPVLPTNPATAWPQPYTRINFILTYSTPFWRDDVKCGDIFSMSSSLNLLRQTDDYPVMVTFDHTDDNGNAALAGVVVGPNTLRKTVSAEFKPGERKEIIMQYLKDPFGDKVMEPLDYQELKWDPYIEFKGTPPHPRNNIKPSEILSTLRTPHGRVYWAGSYTATNWVGTLSGAVQAGRRAADEVLNRLNKSV
ncbi:amine oxidase [flavin-containing] A-like [Amphiura filiformis]|uniref:amine oxidase [flavin-containing] A-like n=1 Tax=Amphiura filiformis TaxID=82378 RepID=UPI003B20B7CF